MLYFYVIFLCFMKLSLLWYLILYFSRVGSHIIFFCMWNSLWYCRISCYIFLHEERAMVLWNFVLYQSACETYSVIVEFYVLLFCMWNALWYCVILCYIFMHVEQSLVLWNLMLYLSVSRTHSGILNFFVTLSVCGTCYSLVELCVIFFCVWNALWYWVISCYIFSLWNMLWYCRIMCYIFHMWNALWCCGIPCYIILRLEHTLVLCNFLLYYSACGTHSGIVEFSVIYFLRVKVALVLYNFM